MAEMEKPDVNGYTVCFRAVVGVPASGVRVVGIGNDRAPGCVNMLK